MMGEVGGGISLWNESPNRLGRWSRVTQVDTGTTTLALLLLLLLLTRHSEEDVNGKTAEWRNIPCVWWSLKI